MNISLAEDLAVLAHAAGTANSTPLVTSYVSAKNCGRINLLVRLGDMASETIDIALFQGQGGATGAKALKAATQLAAHASNNDNTAHVISVDANDLDIENGFDFVAGRVVTGGATGGLVSIFVIGSDLRFAPASLIDAASVTVTP